MNRLVKGDGEIIEEIVSRDRHKAINKVSLPSSSNLKSLSPIACHTRRWGIFSGRVKKIQLKKKTKHE